MTALTRGQAGAVGHLRGNLHLIACAGSGKTEVVARRVANLLAPKSEKGGGLRPANIVALTFTEKAAAELKERVEKRSAERVPGLVGMAEMYVGTIHGFCLDLLKTGVPEFLKFEVLNEVQQSLLVNRNSKRSGLTASTTLTGVTLRRYIDTNTYLQALGMIRESNCREKVLAGNSVYCGLAAYRALLHEKRYLDYSSILEGAVKALETDAGLRTRIATRLKAVIVDEYQDLNPIQERLVKALHELGATLTVVGDDDQTLYQWRGSDLNNILGFANRYPKVKTIKLQDNFRSSVGITDVARLAIAKNAERLPKTMVSAGKQDYEDGDITALQFDSPEEEADHIAATCKALRGTFIRDGAGRRAISWSDMAVLVRVAKCGETVRKALQSASVPAVSIGMSSLFDAPEAEAARQLFYMLARRADVTATDVIRAWADAGLGLHGPTLRKTVAEARATALKMAAENEEVRFSVYNLQRQFSGFLERVGLREENVPDGRGEIAFYNLGCQSASKKDPLSASKRDPLSTWFERRCGLSRSRRRRGRPQRRWALFRPCS